MQKKIIALAIASALTAPAAFADTSNMTVYGVLDADFVSVKSSTVAAGQVTSRTRLDSNASRLGFKGSEDLGDGLQAIYQIETRVNLSGNETGGGGGVFSGLRNTNVGLKGNMGTVFVGHWDTPFKTSHNPVELFDNSSIATATATLGNAGTAVAGSGFSLRENSSVQYWTPVMSNFQGKLAYSAHNTVAKTTTENPSVMSLSAAYDDGAIYAALAYEQHTDLRNSALNTNAKDSGTRLVAAYSFAENKAAKVGLTYEHLNFTNGATLAGGALNNALNGTRNAWELSGKYNFGTSNLGAFYTRVGDLGTNVNTGANQFSLRYGYSFSKRTELYGLYTQISNKAAGTYNFNDVAVVPSAAGAKVSGFGVGLRHAF